MLPSTDTANGFKKQVRYTDGRYPNSISPPSSPSTSNGTAVKLHSKEWRKQKEEQIYARRLQEREEQEIAMHQERKKQAHMAYQMEIAKRRAQLDQQKRAQANRQPPATIHEDYARAYEASQLKSKKEADERQVEAERAKKALSQQAQAKQRSEELQQAALRRAQQLREKRCRTEEAHHEQPQANSVLAETSQIQQLPSQQTFYHAPPQPSIPGEYVWSHDSNPTNVRFNGQIGLDLSMQPFITCWQVLQALLMGFVNISAGAFKNMRFRMLDVAWCWSVAGFVFMFLGLVHLGYKIHPLDCLLFGMVSGSIVWLFNPSISTFVEGLIHTEQRKQPDPVEELIEQFSVFSCASKRFTPKDFCEAGTKHGNLQPPTQIRPSKFYSIPAHAPRSPYWASASAWISPPKPSLGLKEPMPAGPSTTSWGNAIIHNRDLERKRMLDEEARRVSFGQTPRYAPKFQSKQHEIAYNPGYKFEERWNGTRFTQLERTAPAIIPTSKKLFMPMGLSMPTTTNWGAACQNVAKQDWQKRRQQLRF